MSSNKSTLSAQDGGSTADDFAVPGEERWRDTEHGGDQKLEAYALGEGPIAVAETEEVVRAELKGENEEEQNPGTKGWLCLLGVSFRT